MRTALALLVAVLSAPAANATSMGDFDHLAADTLRRVAIVQAVCLRPDSELQPAEFLALKTVRGATVDTFTAHYTWSRPFARPWFKAHQTYLLGLRKAEPIQRYEVIERFVKQEQPQWSVEAFETFDTLTVEQLNKRDSLSTAMALTWDSKGRRLPPTTWSSELRDQWIERLVSCVRKGKPSGIVRHGNEIAFWGDSADAPGDCEYYASELGFRPDSAVRRLAFALWDTTRVSWVRRLGLILVGEDSTAEARRWLLSRPATGVANVDGIIGNRLILRRDTTAEARSLAWRLLLASRTGDLAEQCAFIVLRHDTSEALRAERWRRIAAAQTSSISASGSLGSSRDNWYAANRWTPVEAWRAVNDTSSRLRTVGGRVLCSRDDKKAVELLIHRVRTRKGPQGQALSAAELASIVEALPASRRGKALRFECRLADRSDTLGKVALHAIAFIDTPRVRNVLRRRVSRADRDSSFDLIDAAWELARWAHREDLPVFHFLAIHACEMAAQRGLYAIGRIEGPKAMAMWAEQRYHGQPPRFAWLSLMHVEDEVRREAKPPR